MLETSPNLACCTVSSALHRHLPAVLLSCNPADALLRMLNLHSTATASRDQGELYKVLVLDRHCKDIIAPLLRVSELRAQGITLHLLLEQERQAIPDVPAIYFVHPTPENVERIIQDAQQQLYDVMHVNFATSVPSRLLEQLASGVVKANAVGRVAKLFDEYLSFIALEPSCFSLGLPDSYLALNDPTAKDTQIEVRCEAGNTVAQQQEVWRQASGTAMHIKAAAAAAVQVQFAAVAVATWLDWL
jgi:hypothetical protein